MAKYNIGDVIRVQGHIEPATVVAVHEARPDAPECYDVETSGGAILAQRVAASLAEEETEQNETPAEDSEERTEGTEGAHEADTPQ